MRFVRILADLVDRDEQRRWDDESPGPIGPGLSRWWAILGSNQ
ncbi:hypothetical protein [Isoptericola halotolerans]|nr:hypothetical protein [Isoptericola halotolerans]